MIYHLFYSVPHFLDCAFSIWLATCHVSSTVKIRLKLYASKFDYLILLEPSFQDIFILFYIGPNYQLKELIVILVTHLPGFGPVLTGASKGILLVHRRNKVEFEDCLHLLPSDLTLGTIYLVLYCQGPTYTAKCWHTPTLNFKRKVEGLYWTLTVLHNTSFVR